MQRKTVDRRLIDLSIAWLNNQISYTDFCKEIKKPVHSNGYIQLARALKVAHRSKLIK